MTEIQQKKIGLALASFICGLFFIIPLLGTLLGVIALVLGIVALCKKDQGGQWMAISGIVMGGFSVLLIPIIGLLAAIAIPNLIRARISANEAATENNVQIIAEACQNYYANNQAFPHNAGELTSGDQPYLERGLFVDEGVYGYTYKYAQTERDSFVLTAAPVNEGASGSNYYVIDQNNVLYIDGDKNGIAGSAGDTIVE